MDQKRFGRKFRMLEECMREHENGCRDLIKKMKELPGTPPEEMRRELAEKTYVAMNYRRMYDTLKYYQKDLCNYVCAMQALEKAISEYLTELTALQQDWTGKAYAIMLNRAFLIRDKITESSSGLLAMIGEWYEPEETESEAST